MITRILSPRVLEAMPNGLYRVNDIAAMYFRKETDGITTRNGRFKTFEQLTEHLDGGSIVGPIDETPLTPEEKARVEANRPFIEAAKKREEEERRWWREWRESSTH